MRLRWFTASALALLLAVPLSAQISKAGSITTHRFQPKGVSLPARNTSSARPTTISPSALQQISALMLDKKQRTPAQAKISSGILYTSRMLQGLPAAIGVQYLWTNLELDTHDNLYVDITAHVSDKLLQQLQAEGVRIVRYNSAYHTIRALVPPSSVETIAALPDVIFIQPRQQAMTQGQVATRGMAAQRLSPGFAQRSAAVRKKLSRAITGQGSVTSEGDTTHRAAEARTTFSTTGAGIKIGVLSDGVDGLSESQASGDLGSVTVLPDQQGEGAEGTAMLEVIHDLAPDANLYFATAFNSIDSFAQNIRDLRTAGCDIIVDDVFYFVETPFQDGQDPSILSDTNGGVVIQAVNDVTADGAMYFSSAGNAGNFDDNYSSSVELDFINGGPSLQFPDADMAMFGSYPFDTITYQGYALQLFWSDPLGASANDYDLIELDPLAATIIDASMDFQTGTQDPFEMEFSGYPGDLAVVVLWSGGQDRFLHLDTIWGGLELTSPGQVHGHAAADLAFAVAATPAYLSAGTGFPTGPYPNPFNSTNVVEPYSSDGPRQIFFDADGTPITPGDYSSTGGLIRQKPDITAADGVSVTGNGGFPTTFYGTSAAAPHAAAIAALVKSAIPGTTLSNDTVTTALTSTAVDIERPSTDRDAGSGIIMAFEAVNSVKNFSLPLNLSGITVPAGQSGSQAITITPSPSWDTAITFACSGLPSKSSCAFTPPSVTPGSSATDVTLTISTTAAMKPLGQSQGLVFGIWVGLAGMAGMWGRKRGRALMLLALVLLVPMLLTIVSCGSSDHPPKSIPGTPTGAYAITVTATSGSLVHSTTLQLTVQ